jgi:hypothetical protein
VLLTWAICDSGVQGSSSSSTAAVSMPVSLLDLTAEELIARGIAPIKKEYRLGAIRYLQAKQEPPEPLHTPAAAQEAAAEATGAPGTADATADDVLEAKGSESVDPGSLEPAASAVQSSSRSAPAVAADGDGGHKRTKSKRQRKKASGKSQVTMYVCVRLLWHLQ